MLLLPRAIQHEWRHYSYAPFLVNRYVFSKAVDSATSSEHPW